MCGIAVPRQTTFHRLHVLVVEHHIGIEKEEIGMFIGIMQRFWRLRNHDSVVNKTNKTIKFL